MSVVEKPATPSEDERLKGRYFAYLARFRTIVRYLAYTSDVGEAFRPIVHPVVVKSAYAVSWAYVICDVGYEGHKDYKRGSDRNHITRTVLERSLFQSIASMALPAFTIHTQVHSFQKVFKKVGKFQKWGPTVMGFALIPFIPYL